MRQIIKPVMRSFATILMLLFVCYVTLAISGPLVRMEWRALHRGPGAAIVGSLITAAGFACLTIPCLMLCWVMMKEAWRSVVSLAGAVTGRRRRAA